MHNLLRILNKANWVKDPDGTAELLGVKPTTLLSRMDKMETEEAGGFLSAIFRPFVES